MRDRSADGGYRNGMRTLQQSIRSFIAVAAFSVTMAGAASADPVPGIPNIPLPAGVENIPAVQSILRSLGGVTQTTTGNTAFGRIVYFRRFSMQLETAPGVFRQINLHQGTIINPRGASLDRGMSVEVAGAPQADGSLNADSIVLH